MKQPFPRTNPSEKRCSTCELVKRADLFRKQAKSHDGLGALCKACVRNYNNAYRAANRQHGPRRRSPGRITHGLSLVGGAKRRIYRIWSGMKERCYNPRKPKFVRYGGRGIYVCAEWRGAFPPFYEWSMANGYRDDLQIDRINNDGPYEPSNCRWVTQLVNSRNSSHVTLSAAAVAEIQRLVSVGLLVIGHKGAAKSPITTNELAARFGVSVDVIRDCAAGRTFRPIGTEELSR